VAVETLEVVTLSPGDAVRALAGVEKRDPLGKATFDSIVEYAFKGQCFEARTKGAAVAYIVTENAGSVWVTAAKASGAQSVNMVKVLAEIIPHQSQGRCTSIAFQTARPGLVRKAKKQGFEVVGWILKKEI
jgi:hypothetical protein